MLTFINKIPNWLRWLFYIPAPYLIGKMFILIIELPITYMQVPGFIPSSLSNIIIALFSVFSNLIPTICIGYIAFILAPSMKFKACLLQLILWGIWKTKLLVGYVSYLFIVGDSTLFFSWMSIITYIDFAIVIVAGVIIAIKIYKLEKKTSEATES